MATSTAAARIRFSPPDWSAPLDVEKRLAMVPPESKIKGWLFGAVFHRAKEHGVEISRPSRYVPFKDYPVSEYIELLAEAATRIQPKEPPRQTLRLLGRAVFPSFANSLVGKVILSTLRGKEDPARSGLHTVSRVYGMTSGGGASASLVEEDEDHAIIALRNIWSFPESYHVGIFEGAGRGFERELSVSIAQHSPCDVDIRIEWQPISG